MLLCFQLDEGTPAVQFGALDPRTRDGSDVAGVAAMKRAGEQEGSAKRAALGATQYAAAVQQQQQYAAALQQQQAYAQYMQQQQVYAGVQYTYAQPGAAIQQVVQQPQYAQYVQQPYQTQYVQYVQQPQQVYYVQSA